MDVVRTAGDMVPFRQADLIMRRLTENGFDVADTLHDTKTEEDDEDSGKDPFRPAENWTECPRCGTEFGWNDEDGLEGQQCPCGHVFSPGTPGQAELEQRTPLADALAEVDRAQVGGVRGSFIMVGDGELTALRALAEAVRGELPPPVWYVPRDAVEEMAGREITDEEATRIGRAIENSTVGECVSAAVEQVCGLPPDDDELEEVPQHRNDLGDWCPRSGERTGDGTCPVYCHEADVLAGFDAGDRELPDSTDLEQAARLIELARDLTEPGEPNNVTPANRIA